MAAKSIVVGGGTGMIGRNILQELVKRGYEITVVSRRVPKSNKSSRLLSWADVKANGLPVNTHAVINVAGKNVFGGMLWNEAFKQEVEDSRVKTTKLLADAVANTNAVAYVTISGANYYKPHHEHKYTENDTCKPFDFMSNLCHSWENAAKIEGNANIRQIVIRSGVVLHPAAPIALGLTISKFTRIGVSIGDGTQYMPWIHRNDLTNLFIFSIENDNVTTGVLNGVAPQAISFAKLNNSYAERKKFNYFRVINVPATLLNSILNAERAVMLLDGAEIVPKRVLDLNFNYKYPTIESAVETLY